MQKLDAIVEDSVKILIVPLHLTWNQLEALQVRSILSVRSHLFINAKGSVIRTLVLINAMCVQNTIQLADLVSIAINVSVSSFTALKISQKDS